MKLAATVILYHPDDQVANRISSYASYVSKLFIVDNTEGTNTQFDLIHRLQENDSISYIHDGENKGISIRLNEVCRIAIAEGFEWLLTMDQDSFFEEKVIADFFACINSYELKQETAMFGVQYSNPNVDSRLCKAEKVSFLITSGSVLNLSLFQKIGPFDEALFIDKVDHEYCLRASLLNYQIVRFNNIFLNHSLGKVSYGRSLKNFQLTPRVLHSPLRMYYIFRNYFYLHSKYEGQFKSEFKEMRKELFVRTKNALLYGEKKISLLKNILRGYLDFRKNKMGKQA